MMTEAKARFCNSCNKLVATQDEAYDGKLKWYRKTPNRYWHDKDANQIVCCDCYRPLWVLLDEIKPEVIIRIIERIADSGGPHKENDFSYE